MNATTILALLLVVLLGLEWRYRLRSLRLGSALFALIVLFFAQSNPTRAARWAIVALPAERITQLGFPLSEYESGLATMKQAVVEDSNMGAKARLLADEYRAILAQVEDIYDNPTSEAELSHLNALLSDYHLRNAR